MKKIIFCNTSSKEMLTGLLEKNKGHQIILVQLDLWLKDFSATDSVILKEYKDYLSIEDCLGIEKDALAFSRNWYKVQGADFTVFRGYSLGEMLEVTVLEFFIRVLKNILLIKRIAESEPGAEFIIFDDKSLLSRLFLNFLSDNRIKFEKVNMPARPYASESFETYRVLMPAGSIPGIIKSSMQNIFWAVVNNSLSLMANIKRKSRGKSRLNIYFDHYKGYYTLVERLFKEFDYEVYLPQPAIRNLKHINFLRCVFNNRVRFYPLRYCKSYLSDSLLKEAKQLPDACWKKFISSPGFDKQFIWKGVNFWDTISNELRDRYVAFFSELVLEISYAEYTIQKYKLDTFLMPWDDALFHKSFTSVAKRKGLATMRYQHGISVRNAYLPMPRSDKIVVWGKAGTDFYLDRGISLERIVVSGYPVADLLIRNYSNFDKVKFCKKCGLDSSKKTVFYADSCYAGSTNASSSHYDTSQVLLKFINEVNKLPDTQFLVKFHHGDFAEEEKIDLVRKYNKALNMHIFRWYSDIYEIIANSDAVIAEYSTVALEAMVLDKPVVIFELRHKGMGYLSPFIEGMGVILVKKEAEIIPTIRRIFTDETLLNELAAGRKKFMEYEGHVQANKNSY